MPHIDYHDPEYTYPRLEVHLQLTEPDAFWIKIWLWKQAGDGPHVLLNRKRGGSGRDAHEIIEIYKRQYKAECGPDDIIVGEMPAEEISGRRTSMPPLFAVLIFAAVIISLEVLVMIIPRARLGPDVYAHRRPILDRCRGVDFGHV